MAANKCCAPSGRHTDHSKATTNTKNCISFAVDNAGAYQYVCQVLFGKCPTQHNDFYVLLEENGLQDDILGICIIPDAYLYLMTFFDHATGTTKSIIESDVTLLQFWKVYNAHCYHNGRPIITAQDILSINPAEHDALFQDFLSGLPLGTTCTQHERYCIPPVFYKIPDCYNCIPFEDNLTNCSNYSSTTQSVHETSTALQNTSNESLPGNGENTDSNLPVKTCATANNVPITKSSLFPRENTISVPVPTPVNEKAIYQKAYDHSNNVSTTSIHSAQSIGSIDCASGGLNDRELLDASVSLDWNIDMDYHVLDWSFDLWEKLQPLALVYL